MLDGLKGLLASRTTWAVLVAFFSVLAGLFGVEIAPEDQSALIEGLSSAGAAIGIIWAVIERIRARRAVKAAQAQQTTDSAIRAHWLATVAAVAMTLLAIGACTTVSQVVPVPETDRQNLAAAEITFTALVRQANALKADGTLSGDTLRVVQYVVASGSTALEAAHAAIAAGDQAALAKWLGVVAAAAAELERTLSLMGVLSDAEHLGRPANVARRG